MARYDFSAPRLFVAAPLSPEGRVDLDANQTNYLLNVLRLRSGDPVIVFNGRHGEWRATVARADKRKAELLVHSRLREQTPNSEIWLLFAPLKHARLDYMVQKAVEMGVSRLMPVLTVRTQTHRLNLDRMKANAIEAAEQCGVLNLPIIDGPKPLSAVLAEWPADRTLVFCDEDASVANPITSLTTRTSIGYGVLIGPEGGFDERERTLVSALSASVAFSLGPRILRADTAAVAALAIVQAVVGDWRSSA